MPNPYPLLAFTAASGSGKSVACEHLRLRYGYTVLDFADPIRDLLDALEISYSLKDFPHQALNGHTPRQAAQGVGEALRRLNKSFWVNLTLKKARSLQMQGVPFCIHSVRNWAEYHMVKEISGQLCRIYRPETQPSLWEVPFLHSTERLWRFFPVEHVIYNSGRLPHFLHEIDNLIGV